VGIRPDLRKPGPFHWHPSPAAACTLKDINGKDHSLADYQDKPVLVIVYLGAGCAHCIEQLNAFAPVIKDFEALGLSVVAISTDSVSGLKDTFAQSKAEGMF